MKNPIYKPKPSIGIPESPSHPAPKPKPGTGATPKPPTETPGERAAREAIEAEARRQAAATTAAAGAASASAAALLTEYGLEDLIGIVDGWIRGGLSLEEAMLQLRNPASDAGKIFDARFPAIQLRRKDGLAPLSPGEYVAYERRARQIMESAGLPKGFYDSRDDFTGFLVRDWSTEELSARVTEGFVEVANAPAEVRDAFGQFFGASGDAALASYFLDPGKSLPVLSEIVNTAKVGGAGRQYGFHVNADKARQVAQTGATFAQARAGFSTLSEMGSLFDETVGEGIGNDLAAEREGVDAVFGTDQGQAKKKVLGRLDERVAAMSGAGGGAANESGAFGLGSARR